MKMEFLAEAEQLILPDKMDSKSFRQKFRNAEPDTRQNSKL